MQNQSYNCEQDLWQINYSKKPLLQGAWYTYGITIKDDKLWSREN